MTGSPPPPPPTPPQGGEQDFLPLEGKVDSQRRCEDGRGEAPEQHRCCIVTAGGLPHPDNTITITYYQTTIKTHTPNRQP